MITLIISNEEMNDIMKILKLVEETALLINGISKTIKNKAKQQIGRFLSMLLGTLLRNLLASKGELKAGEGAIATTKGQGIIREGQDFQCRHIL